jgi:pantoate--beta-alanine ligase
LNFAIRIIGAETVRADDGLALSSRNRYLTPAERAEAPRLYHMLSDLGAALKNGERDLGQLEGNAQAALESNGWRVEYVSIRDQRTLMPPTEDTDRFVILGAAWLGTTRLIDNIEVSLDRGGAV